MREPDIPQHCKDESRLASRAYPFAMPQLQTSPAPSASSFASVLSSLTPPTPWPPAQWDDSALADDVAVISYERALQAQARMRSSNSALLPPSHPPRAKSSPPRATIVTLRLSHAESAKLHERATEAGLTVSAYMRSCVFEVESLRAQVRDALTQFRSAASHEPQDKRDPVPPASPTWRSRLLPRWCRTERLVGA